MPIEIKHLTIESIGKTIKYYISPDGIIHLAITTIYEDIGDEEYVTLDELLKIVGVLKLIDIGTPKSTTIKRVKPCF